MARPSVWGVCHEFWTGGGDAVISGTTDLLWSGDHLHSNRGVAPGRERPLFTSGAAHERMRQPSSGGRWVGRRSALARLQPRIHVGPAVPDQPAELQEGGTGPGAARLGQIARWSFEPLRHLV